MKKKSLSGNVLLFIVIAITVLFIGCQKDGANATENAISSENTTVKTVAGSGTFQGSISEAYAASLQKNFAKKYDASNQTLQVAFTAKDLAAFINSLQSKYKSDIIYVNFGVYGAGAPPPNPKDNGRMTVFFTGNNTPKSSGTVKINGTASDDAYLNHGQIYP